MKDPKPIHLMTSEEVRKGGWAAEARDRDGHLISTMAGGVSNEMLGEWVNECRNDGWTVTVWPRRG